MKKPILTFLFSFILATSAFAAWRFNPQTGKPDFYGASPSGTDRPATCNVGDSFVDTDADTNGSLYICVDTDTWKEVDDDGAGGGGDLLADGTVPLTADWNAGDGSFDITAVEFKGALVGNASTATALAADPTDCGAGTCATAIAASGNLTCGITPLVSGGTLTSGYHCRYDGAGIDCDRLEDGTGACAANSVCMGGHTHAISSEVSGLGANMATFLATPSSANLLATTTDETGSSSGSPLLVFNQNPSIAAMVGTGLADFGGAVLEIPNGAAVTDPAGAGQVAVDTTSDQFLYYGGAQRVLTYRYTDCRTLETPTDADDGIPVWAFPEPRTITDVHCWTQGGTSIALTICDDGASNCLEAITCDADGADDDGSIANGTFTANENIEWNFGAPTGTVNWVKVCITTTITAD